MSSILKIDSISTFSRLILLSSAFFISGSYANKFCTGLNETLVALNNGNLYPKNCSEKTIPLGTKCAIVCKEGYGYKDFSHAETVCTLLSSKDAGWTSDDYFYRTQCNVLIKKCPALDSSEKVSWSPYWCSRSRMSIGSVCKPDYCPFRAGVQQKVCQPNGTWTPLGGFYCPQDLLRFSLNCPSTLTVKTGPGKATADARGRFSNPTLEYPESELKMTVLGGGTIDAFSRYNRNDIKFTITDPQNNRQRQCEFRVMAKDEEPPMVYKCPEELHYTVAEGLKRKIDFDEKKELKIIDAVNNLYQANQDGRNSTAFNRAYVAPGNWTLTYRLVDASGNEAYCKIKIRVKSKPCKLSPVSTGSYLVVKGPNSGKFYSQCKNGSVSMCSGFNQAKMYFNVSSCYISHHVFLGLACGRFAMGPLPSCVNETSLPDSVNGSCPNGTILGLFFNKHMKCFPCERGMFFNATSDKCQLCPDNTTTYTVGSTECIPCPKHQMTKLKLAPRFCEDICDPGSWLDSSNQTCTKCPRGSFAGAAARNCQKCSYGLTTLAMGSTSIDDCVVGDVITKDSGFIRFNKQNITIQNATRYRYRIDWSIHPLDQINQLLAFQFNSSYLSDCSKGHIRLFSIVNTIEFGLTGNICGSAVNKPLFVSVMKDQPAFLDFHFSDINAADLTFRFGVANCSLGYFFDFSLLRCTPCPVNTFRRLYNERVCHKCKPGTAAPIEAAIICQDECPKGTTRNGSACQNCPIGYYQDETEKTVCKKCPNGTLTSQSRTEKVSDCVAACGPGEYYKPGNSCLPCPAGLYHNKPSHSDRMCLFCPSGQTTISKGSTSCVAKCSYEGEYYNKTEKQCKKCPIGTYKLTSLNQVTACTSCPTNHTTNRLGAASISECIDTYDNCSPNPCKFPGWCEDTGTDFKCHCPFLYSGRYCETKLHVCQSNPCKNNATCYNYHVWSKWYYCACQPGWTGRNCETVYHACSSNPCYYGNCTLQGDNDFKCNCPPWHGGKLCEEYLNKPCYSYPCLNRGTCTNRLITNSVATYNCTCRFPYTGRNCETEIDYCINNKCNKTGTYTCRNDPPSYRCVCNSFYRQRYCNESYGCNAGEYLVNQKCKKCPKGTYQLWRNRLSDCIECPKGHTTIKEGGIRYADCAVLESLKTLKMTLKITSVAWSDKLSDKSSTEFTSLASKWEEAITKLYKNESHFKDVVVNGFSKGSVVCDFSVYFENGVKDPKAQFEKGIESGSIDGFSVDKSSLKTDEKDGTKSVSPPKKKNYTLMAVLIVVGVLLVIGIVTLYLLYNRNRERVRVRFDKMMGKDETVSIDYPMTNK